MTDLDDVPTWKRKQSLANQLIAALRNLNGYSKGAARRLAQLQRVANFDKKITEEEIRIRRRAGDF